MKAFLPKTDKITAVVALLLFSFSWANVSPVLKKHPLPHHKKTVFTNQPPVLTATGDQIYCPGTPMKIVTDMNIQDPDDTTIDAIYIQISSGYDDSTDELSLTGIHPAIVAIWDVGTGKLTLKSPANIPVLYTDFIAAIKDVIYTNSAANPSGVRNFSITVGQANYLPSNGHYYQYTPSLGITWTQARDLAAASTYYGLQGYLATITAADEAQLSGEQAAGAGWIGGSDAETEGVWKWVTGPEAGLIFWNGGPTGTTPNFAFWNTGEPNNLGDENYAHVTAPGVGITGSWNDLSNTGSASGDYQPKGYIIEYGGMPGDPTLHIAASSRITIPSITSTTDASRCGAGSLTLKAVSDSTVRWYDVPSGGTALATGTDFTTPNLTATTIYYADVFDPSCTTATRAAVTATINDIPIVTITSAPVSVCEDTTATIDAATTAGNISWYDSATSTTAIGSGTTFTTSTLSEETTFYAEASNNGCPSPRISVTIEINPKPVLHDDQIGICQNGTQILDAGISGDTYLWSTGQTTQKITVAEPGTYTVSVTSPAPESCSATKTVTVILQPVPVISEVQVSSLKITILTSNTGNFEYSVDGVNYQASNILSVPDAGAYTAYARSVDGCGENTKPFIVLMIPPFFTPNGDNFNDYWTVHGLVYYKNAKVDIFDRYGKLITELGSRNLSWDGKLNGRPLPADDYWFVFKQDDTTPEIRGHFSLVR